MDENPEARDHSWWILYGHGHENAMWSCSLEHCNPPTIKTAEQKITIPNPHSPKIPSHLFQMLIFIPDRFHMEKPTWVGIGEIGFHSGSFLTNEDKW